MCDFTTMLTLGATALSTALNVTQQMQQAGRQRGQYDWLAAQQRNEAAIAESQARMAAQEGEAAEAEARARTGQRLGAAQARLAAQGSDLTGSALDVLGDIAADGERDGLSLRYRGMRRAWEHGLAAAARAAEARRLAEATGRIDPTPGILRSLLR